MEKINTKIVTGGKGLQSKLPDNACQVADWF
ncbi:hypothetical protein CLV62_13720 [Dysgonomonas alginatilytica]|uniref:Uncharacterized protein n=1 Tax=Dysgonomonas alginatilytica TaxID=1605892 RepID=A0A2V3PJ81_9BACT|nr:hypothetical protein CLV62_13720 [Dysgonomonas alginatilytica]